MSCSGEVTGRAPADDITEKKIRSQPPDIIVSVGSGESVQEFKCYKVILSFASKYLDTMLSSGMKEEAMGTIDFPDKDPGEWKLFYEFINPQQIGEAKHGAHINSDNVLKLLPWFHEFQMDGYVKECDKYLAENYFSEDQKSFLKERQANESEVEHQTRLGQRKGRFDIILHMLQLTSKYDLKSAKDTMEKMMADLMIISPHTNDLFDFSAVKSLLLLILPLELNETGLRMSGGECKHLWPLFEKILSPHTSTLSQEMIDDTVNFPHHFFCYMQIKIEKERMYAEKEEKEKAQAEARRFKKSVTSATSIINKAQAAQASATSIISTIIHEYPQRIYDELPGEKTSGGRIDSVGRRCFKQIVSEHYEGKSEDFQCLGITLPSDYHL